MSQNLGYASLLKPGRAPFNPPGSDLDCETAYWTAGDLTSGKVPLICLHGGPGAPARYLNPLALLNQKFDIPVIIYDQIGCGSSTRLPGKKGDTAFWTYDLFIAELESLISHLELKNFDLFCHSWGGWFASFFALKKPAGLRKLIICSSTSNSRKLQAATEVQYRQLPGDAGRILVEGDKEGKQDTPEYQEAMQQWYRRHMIRIDPPPQDFVDCVALMNEDTTVSSTMSNRSLDNPGLVDRFDIVPHLHGITEEAVPGGMLVLFGKYDMTPEELIRPYWTEVKAKVRWERFEESSHMMMLEETDRFIDVVGHFLTDGEAL